MHSDGRVQAVTIRPGADSGPVNKSIPFSLHVAAGRPNPSRLRNLMSDSPKVGL